MKKYLLLSFIPFILLGCSNSGQSYFVSSSSKQGDHIDFVTISKQDYTNKTLGGLLGQFAGFLSGYEFVKDGPDPAVGLPEYYFDFINGPCAGNYTYFRPGSYASEAKGNIYDRLKYNTEKGLNVVWSDDDYHIDIFNQMIIDQYGYTPEDIKNAWTNHAVHDWGGGSEAARIMNVYDYISPFTGTLEAGNIYSWCTEAYIENETLGMNAGGMPGVALSLTESFAGVSGYFEPVMWGKFFATMYSLAYTMDNVNEIVDQGRKVVAKGSWVDRCIDAGVYAFKTYGEDYVSAAKYIYANFYRNTWGIDNVQTNPGVNGANTVYSILAGQGNYMKAAKFSSLMGFDGDCTAAIVLGIYGIINGFKEGNEEYATINEKIYQNGEGLYYNDNKSGYDPYINANYPEFQKITDIVDLYVKNFEKILVDNGGSIEGNSYKIPNIKINEKASFLFDNYDLENDEDSPSGFLSNKNAIITVYGEGDNTYTHSGYRGLMLSSKRESNSVAKVYHTYKGLTVGKYYRLSTFVRSDVYYYSLFAAVGDSIVEEVNYFGNTQVVNNTLLFKATASTMNVGVYIPSDEENTLVLDDFMLEEISNDSYGYLMKPELAKKYLSSVAYQLNGVPLNKQVVVRLKYRCIIDIDVVVMRNENKAFSVPLKACSIDNNSGVNAVEFKYQFKTEDEILKLSFLGNSIYFESIEILNDEVYLFR